MAIRRVKVVIDTVNVLAGKAVGSCVYMVAPSALKPLNQGQFELGITVNINDQVIWSPCGFDSNTKIKLIANQDGSPAFTNNMTVKYNDDGTVTGLAKTTCNSAIYRFAFIVDDDDFTQFSWDPYITIQ
ncbi:MAG: hypothetical protein HRT38_14475 [Alteromonadaceae bacterium]|nr:hypothetical protein [Alteromonadaceae bacterium]